MLRSHQLCGLKFRREHPIGGFIADFACEAKKLVIEIDGGDRDQTTARNIEREKTLRSLGWDGIWFTDKEVEQDAEPVARAVARHLQLAYSFSKRHGGGSGMKAQARSQHQASIEPTDDRGPSPKPRSSASTLPRGG
jgi:very-short-patch-repair endonuclease